MKPQPAEVEALEKSGNLLRFAAENVKEVKELSEPTVSTIATAWKQYEDQNWDPDISTKFWTAYATICALIRPVTLDSLSTNQKNIQVRKWIWFGPFVEASLGDRSARRYLLFLMILLALSLVFGFLSSTANNVNLEIQKSVEEANPIAADIRGQIDNLWQKFGNDKSLDDAEDDDTRKKVSQLRNRLQELYYFSSVPASPESQALIPS